MSLRTKSEENVLELTLDRPEKRNALNEELIEALTDAFADASKNDQLRAIVLRGSGKDFCSGADLASLQKIAESDISENLEDAEKLLKLFLEMRNTPVPVIAQVHGRALAGGCGLATACDIVLASDTARFGYPEVKIGFVPAMVMAILRRNLSEKRAFELVTLGEEFGAKRAVEIGLINAIAPESDLPALVAEYLEKYRKTSRSAVLLTKKLLYQMDSNSFESALSQGAEVNAIARLTEDCQNGIAKFLNK